MLPIRDYTRLDGGTVNGRIGLKQCRIRLFT
jgi:hypothetical protein